MLKTIHVSQDPARAAVARYARNGACLVCVCVCVFCVCVCVFSVCVCVCVFSVCVCVSLQDTLVAPTLPPYSRLTPKNKLHIKIYTQHNFPILQ